MPVSARSGLARAGFTRAGLAAPPFAPTGATLGALVDITRDRILETLSLITPAAPLVAPQGVPGSSTYRYRVAALNAAGHSIASLEGVTTLGAAVLSATSFNRIQWTPVARATGYRVYRTAGGPTQGVIGLVGDAPTFLDIGRIGDGTSAPTTNTSGTIGQFWSDEELLGIMILGAKDLWRSFIDLHQEHFFTVDDQHVTLPIGASQLDGIPANVHRVLLLASRNAAPTSPPALVKLQPQKYNSPEFLGALNAAAIDPSQGGTVYYDVTGAGAPTGAPTIYTAPTVSAVLPIRLVYIPTLSGSLTFADQNPVPGESDAALIAYTVAFALAKDREDRSPDPNWLAVYSTEKNSCLVASTPRQEQEAPVVKGVFDDIFGPGLSGDAWDD